MMASILESYGRPGSSSSNSDVPTLGDLISCVERWLPPVLRTATTTDKVKLFDAIATLYRKRDEHRQLVHEQYRRTVQTYYKARHPEIFLFQPEIFLAPSMLHMLQDGSEAAVRRTICAHGPLLYSFDMLQPRICSLILDEVENFERWLHHANMQKSPPTSLSSNGVVLDDFGLSPVLNMLVHHCIAPLVPVLFPQLGRAPLDSHHGYVVSHCPNQEPSIGCHVDNSEVTLNVSLYSPLEGGELYFKGVRCIQHLDDPERDLEVAEYKHIPGRALLHLGKHRHGAHPVLKGKRANLILWCRSSQFRENTPPVFVCPTWCNATDKHKTTRRKNL